MRNHVVDSRGREPAPAIAAWGASGLAAVAAAVFAYRYAIRTDHPPFWDLRVYQGAIGAHALGLNPYDPAVWDTLHVDKLLRYTSTPLVDRAFAAIAALPGWESWLKPLFLSAHFTGVAVTVWALTVLFVGRRPLDLLFAGGAFLLMFSTAGLGALAAANNGTMLYGLICASALRGFLAGRWGLFHLAVAAATAVKPIYASWWLLPVMADGFDPRQLLPAAAAGAAAASTYAVFLVADPATVQQWMQGLWSQAGQSANDLGGNVLAGVAMLPYGRAHPWLPVAAQLAYGGLLCALGLVGRFTGPARWAALMTVAVFVNPRPMPYDVAVAAIPVLALAARAAPGRSDGLLRLTRVSLPLIGVALILPHERLGLVPAPFLQPALVLIVLALAARASRSSDAAPPKREGAADARRTTLAQEVTP